MSRTYKDKPYKFRDPEQAWEYRYDDIQYVRIGKDYYTGEFGEWPGVYWCKKPGVLTKKKKRVDTEHHWMSTPSWWTHQFMTKPQRRAGKLWERKVLFEDLEETDPPNVGRKPHIYYW